MSKFQEMFRELDKVPQGSHRRRNPLTGDWVLVSPGRTDRPWLGARETIAAEPSVPHDAACYLCPGNARAKSAVNPGYTGTYVFQNDFPALDAGAALTAAGSAEAAFQVVHGECRVLCYSPRHDLSLGQLDQDAVRAVVSMWVNEWKHFDARDEIAYALIFENRGAQMGASNPHPHGQLWATSIIPNEIEHERQSQAAYFDAVGTPMLADYLDAEVRLGTRIVAGNGSWVALVPFWAVWPFELLVVPRHACSGFDDLTQTQHHDLAALIGRIVSIYDSIFGVPFPYSMGWHTRPSDGGAHAGWVMHGHFYPPLLRSASVRKFLVGYEMLAMPQRDITPESAAALMRGRS